MHDNLSKDEIEAIVQSTVVKTLEELGINLSTPDARREFIEDQYYTRAWRKAVQRGTKIGFGTMITVIVTGALGVFWLGFAGMFK